MNINSKLYPTTGVAYS